MDKSGCYLIYFTFSNNSRGNSEAGFPAATSVIQVAYTIYDVLRASANSSGVKNFVDRYFADMKDKIDVYESAQAIFGKAAGADNALGFEKPVKTVNISKVKELGHQTERLITMAKEWEKVEKI